MLTDLGAEIVPRSAARRTGATSMTAAGSMRTRSCLQLTRARVRAQRRVSLSMATAIGSSWSMSLGRIVDGDQLLYIIARARAKSQDTRAGRSSVQ